MTVYPERIWLTYLTTGIWSAAYISRFVPNSKRGSGQLFLQIIRAAILTVVSVMGLLWGRYGDWYWKLLLCTTDAFFMMAIFQMKQVKTVCKRYLLITLLLQMMLSLCLQLIGDSAGQGYFLVRILCLQISGAAINLTTRKMQRYLKYRKSCVQVRIVQDARVYTMKGVIDNCNYLKYMGKGVGIVSSLAFEDIFAKTTKEGGQVPYVMADGRNGKMAAYCADTIIMLQNEQCIHHEEHVWLAKGGSVFAEEMKIILPAEWIRYLP